MAIYYIDGEYLNDSEALMPLSDLAVLRGYALFDFLRTYGGRPFYLHEHLLRLQHSAALLHIPMPWSITALAEIVNTTLKMNSFEEANIRIVVSGGDSLDSITPLGVPRLFVMVTPVATFPEIWYRDGVKVITTGVTRYIPAAKSTNYIKAIIALRQARDRGAIESLYVDENDRILEGTTTNVFVVIDGQLLTPEEGVLHGITRKVVLKLAEGKIDRQLKEITRQDIHQCDEVFLTSSTKEIVPVLQVDDHRVSENPGPVTRELMTLFDRYTGKYRDSSPDERM